MIGCTRTFRVQGAKARASEAVYSEIDSVRVACATASDVVCKRKDQYVSLFILDHVRPSYVEVHQGQLVYTFAFWSLLCEHCLAWL